jgi:hypothetical protein
MARLNQKALKTLVARVKERTEDAGKRVAEKRERRKMQREDYSAKYSGPLNNGGQTPKERLNWMVVRRWFHEALTRNFADKHTIPVEQGWWGGKEISLAKKLLGIYSGELLQTGIVHLCDNWETMVENSNGRLSGLPTIGFLWGARERIIGEVEAGEQPIKKVRKRHHRAEYDPEDDDMPGVGW